MKKIKVFSLCLLVLLSVSFVSCSANSTQAVAKDLDTSVKNLVIAISSLDWPEDGVLDTLGDIQNDASTSNVVFSDTQIDTSEIYTWLESAHLKINVLLSTRGDLLLYLNEIYSGNVAFESADLLSINVYLNILKDNSNYLNSYNGMLKNQINQAITLFESQENVNLINAYLIKAVETLQVRCAKIDTSVLAMSSIKDIIKCNLVNDYYSYNEHKIEEVKEPEIDNEQNEDVDKQDSIKEEQNKQDLIGVEDESTEEPSTEDMSEANNNEQNAINFDSEAQQVDNSTNLQESNKNIEVDDLKVGIDDNLRKEKCANKTNSDTNAPINDINYDDQIMTLEEPIIGDAEEKAPVNKELSKMQNNAKIDTKNTISQSKFDNLDEIDKEFTLNENEIVENSPVTREIIKENEI